MNSMAMLLEHEGVGVTRFEFPYMAARRLGGSKRPPDRQPKLLQTWRDVIAQSAGQKKLFIGGKSMGGRMATLLAHELEQEGIPVAGVVCLGYPFHPAGKPERLRVEHLQSLTTPTLIVQGTRDPMGTLEEVASYDLSKAVTLSWLEDGNHNLKPRVRSGFTHEEHLQKTAIEVTGFLRSCE